LPLEAALEAFTAGSAFTNHDADGGRLAIGSRADLAVLDLYLYRLDGLLSDASVVCTLAAGRVVHSAI
jgi:hypothetical protein